MAIIDLRSRSIETLAEDYARSRSKRSRPVSMTAAIRALRTISPDLAHTDRELADIVAAAAVRYGHVVDFDSVPGEATGNPSQHAWG